MFHLYLRYNTRLRDIVSAKKLERLSLSGQIFVTKTGTYSVGDFLIHSQGRLLALHSIWLHILKIDKRSSLLIVQLIFYDKSYGKLKDSYI